MIKTGWMKLDKFHVGDSGAGPISHGQTVSGCDIRIGCDQINLSRASRAENGIFGQVSINLSLIDIQDVSAQTLSRFIARFLFNN